MSTQALAAIKTAELLREKKIPSSFWNKRKLPADDTEIDAFVKEVDADYIQYTQDLSGPNDNSKRTSNTSKADPGVVAYAKKQNDEALAKKNK